MVFTIKNKKPPTRKKKGSEAKGNGKDVWGEQQRGEYRVTRA